jgi:hypothetical protein
MKLGIRAKNMENLGVISVYVLKQRKPSLRAGTSVTYYVNDNLSHDLLKNEDDMPGMSPYLKLLMLHSRILSSRVSNFFSKIQTMTWNQRRQRAFSKVKTQILLDTFLTFYCSICWVCQWKGQANIA